jgi:glycosyltransferase involved in cell wall biosynthesis
MIARRAAPPRGRHDDVPRTGKLRVVYVDHVARLSGGEISLLRVLVELVPHVDAHVVLGEEGPLVERLRAIGVRVEVIPLAPRLRDLRKDRTGAGRMDLLALSDIPAYVYRLSRRIRQLDADLVHTNSLKAALYGGAAARLAGVPAVWHIRDRIAPDYLPRSAAAFVRGAARVVPTAVVANSHATLSTLPRTRAGRGRGSVPIVVPEAVEEQPPRRAREAGELTVGMIGRLAPWKGQDVFLEGFAAAFRGYSVRGRIIGSALFGEDAYAESLAQRAERLGLSGQVEFRGFRDDVWAELAELDIVVHCSTVPEPFGMVVLEAMAAGIPVVAADGGGPAEIISNGVDGLLTPAGDPGELAAALRRLHDDPDLRERLAAAGRERSLAFTPAKTAPMLLALYREIVPDR